MKILKKMLSVFLTAAIMVGVMCASTVNAGAATSSDLFIEFEESGDGYYFVHLILPRMIYTIFAAVLFYPLFHWIHRLLLRLVEKEE